ncbi:MAG: nucleotidyltransferase domain-containing protein, partial [Chthoniobacterales bacterium]
MQRGIRRLALFGSVLRHDFNPQASDVDVLVDF